MDYPLSDDIQQNPKILMQRAGYHEFIDPNTGETSYIRRLTTEFYPRFHVYVDETRKGRVVSLHIDQKHASYAGSKKHAGEYSGPIVEEELERIKAVINGEISGKAVLTGVEEVKDEDEVGGGVLPKDGPVDLKKKLGL